MNEPTISLADESLWLAPYAMHAAASAGRVHAESPHPYRTPFQRDRDRIVHSSAYRRLAHKTQVFTGDRGRLPSHETYPHLRSRDRSREPSAACYGSTRT